MFTSVWRCLVLLGALVFCACPPPAVCETGDEPVCELDSGYPVDLCDTRDEALENPACHLTVGTPLEDRYVSTLSDGGLDTDWYLVQLPDNLTTRSLLHVNAGYLAQQTAVNFSLNLLRENGTTSLASEVNRKGAAAPKPVDVVMPFSESNAKLLLYVGDEGNTAQIRVDNVNPYRVFVEVLTNPDQNEPNDTTPTPIALNMSGGVLTGTSDGYLATNDDVDLFNITVPAGSRQILYTRVTTDGGLLPPPPFRVSYTLLAPDNTPISEGVAANESVRVDLATARLVTAGTYKLKINGFRPETMTGPVKGDLRMRYQVEVRVLSDIDMREGVSGNDTPATAASVAMSGSVELKGRISYVPDEEWFKLVIAPSATPRVLRYQFTPSMGGGRFPPISLVPTRQIRLMTEVTQGASLNDRKVACRTSTSVCPKGYTFSGTSPTRQQDLVDAICNSPKVETENPLCLWAERNEEAQIMPLRNLKNFVGSVPVPAGGVNWLLGLRDVGKGLVKYADDSEWTLQLTLVDDPDELRASRTVVSQGASSTASGVISFGHGEILGSFDLNEGPGVRGPNDYDNYVTDTDDFQFDFNPPGTGARTWGLSWTIDHTGLSGPPAELALNVTLCGSSASLPDGGLCASSRRLILAANTDPVTPWYLPVIDGNRRLHYTKTTNMSSTTFTVTEDACYCFRDQYFTAGRYYVSVAAVNRTDNAPLNYSIRQTVTPYPGSAMQCPSGADGGCRF